MRSGQDAVHLVRCLDLACVDFDLGGLAAALPPSTWWIMILELGSENRLPFGAGRQQRRPCWPQKAAAQRGHVGLDELFMVSKIAMPADTEPPAS